MKERAKQKFFLKYIHDKQKKNEQDLHISIDSFRNMEDSKMEGNNNNMHDISLLHLVPIFLGLDYILT